MKNKLDRYINLIEDTNKEDFEKGLTLLNSVVYEKDSDGKEKWIKSVHFFSDGVLVEKEIYKDRTPGFKIYRTRYELLFSASNEFTEEEMNKSVSD